MNAGSADLVLRLGINNIADKDPPLAGSFTLGPLYGNGNAYPQLYDSPGRYVFFDIAEEF